MTSHAPNKGDLVSLFFLNDTSTTEIYTLSLHDALPISVFINDPEIISTTGAQRCGPGVVTLSANVGPGMTAKWFEDPNDQLPVFEGANFTTPFLRSEEHTSELQSRPHLVCRLLLEKKKK